MNVVWGSYGPAAADHETAKQQTANQPAADQRTRAPAARSARTPGGTSAVGSGRRKPVRGLSTDVGDLRAALSSTDIKEASYEQTCT